MTRDVTATPYAGDVQRRFVVRDGEERIVSVTPVSRGVLRPVVLVLALAATVRYLVDTVHGVAHYQLVIVLVVVGPTVLVVATRIWRWRSHKIHITSHRVVVEGGVARHIRTGIDLRDVIAVRAVQGLGGRITARGEVVLETAAGPWTVGRVRHPAALVRLIEGERSRHRESTWGYDDVVVPPDRWDAVDLARPRYRST